METKLPDAESNAVSTASRDDEIDPIVEKSLVRRLDLVLLPTLGTSLLHDHQEDRTLTYWRSPALPDPHP
jgi:hypothetical protein